MAPKDGYNYGVALAGHSGVCPTIYEQIQKRMVL